MRKTIGIVAACMMVLPGAAFADKPDGTFNSTNSNSQGSTTGQQASAINQNGQFVSGNCDCGIDQTTAPQSRADLVRQNNK